LLVANEGDTGHPFWTRGAAKRSGLRGTAEQWMPTTRVVGFAYGAVFVFYSDFKYSTRSVFSWLVSPSLKLLS
jgi:hypothetical protein